MLSKVAREETEYVPPAKKAKSLGYSAEWELWEGLDTTTSVTALTLLNFPKDVKSVLSVVIFQSLGMLTPASSYDSEMQS